MSEITRREAFGAASMGAAALALGTSAAGASAQAAPAPAFAGNHKPKPPRFDPAKRPGLSEKLIWSHWENNYQGSVRAPSDPQWAVNNRAFSAIHGKIGQAP